MQAAMALLILQGMYGEDFPEEAEDKTEWTEEFQTNKEFVLFCREEIAQLPSTDDKATREKLLNMKIDYLENRVFW